MGQFCVAAEQRAQLDPVFLRHTARNNQWQKGCTKLKDDFAVDLKNLFSRRFILSLRYFCERSYAVRDYAIRASTATLTLFDQGAGHMRVFRMARKRATRSSPGMPFPALLVNMSHL